MFAITERVESIDLGLGGACRGHLAMAPTAGGLDACDGADRPVGGDQAPLGGAPLPCLIAQADGLWGAEELGLSAGDDVEHGDDAGQHFARAYLH